MGDYVMGVGPTRGRPSPGRAHVAYAHRSDGGVQLLRGAFRLPRAPSQAPRSRPASGGARLGRRRDHARGECDPGDTRHRQADAQIPGALHGRHRLRLCRALHRRLRRPAICPSAGRQAGVVVQAHGQHDRVLRRGGDGLLGGQLRLSSDDGALALADHGGHARHRDLDHLLQAPLQRPQVRGCGVRRLTRGGAGAEQVEDARA